MTVGKTSDVPVIISGGPSMMFVWSGTKGFFFQAVLKLLFWFPSVVMSSQEYESVWWFSILESRPSQCFWDFKGKPQYWWPLLIHGLHYWWRSHSSGYWGWCEGSTSGTARGVVSGNDVTHDSQLYKKVAKSNSLYALISVLFIWCLLNHTRLYSLPNTLLPFC